MMTNKGAAALFPCVLMSSRQRFSRFARVEGLVTLRQRLVRSLPLVAGASVG
jgi:hypothetical protein